MSTAKFHFFRTATTAVENALQIIAMETMTLLRVVKLLLI